jgi:hypothetical protein
VSHKDRVDIMRKVHKIFCGLTGKELTLFAADPPGRTDTETYLSVPIEDQEVDVIHKHEWTHVLFGTDLYARAHFVELYLEERKLKGLSPTSLQEDFIDMLANAVDDVRVHSLHEMVYPGSAERLKTRWERLLADGTKGNLTMRVIALGIDAAVVPGSNWDRFDPVILRALELVKRASYPTVLVATRIILDHVIGLLADEEVLQEPGVPQAGGVRRMTKRKPYSNERAVVQMEKAALQSRGSALLFDTESPRALDRDTEKTRHVARTAMGLESDDALTQLLSSGMEEVQTLIRRLSSKLHEIPPDQDLLKGMHRTKIIHVATHDAEEFRLSERDSRLASELRRIFIKLIDQRTRARAEEGSHLDPERYIEFLHGQGDMEFFLEDRPAKGFDLIILLDMSGSMQQLWMTVSRAAKVAAVATKFPFSNVKVWGFSGDSTGGTVIIDFEDPTKGYLPKKTIPEAWGLTPLHIAVPVAARQLAQMPGRMKHLLIVSDGNPQTIGAQSNISLREQVRQDVVDASRRRIRVSTVLLGNTLPSSEADRMLGPKRWVRVGDNPEDLFFEMTDLVRTSFTNYLRS